MLNYWWVSRPKRKLNSVPSTLALLAEKTLNQTWSGERGTQLSFEEALEASGLKRPGDRRDQAGSGGRTYAVWIMSLGLTFTQTKTNRVQLTLAGEAIMNGESPVKILTNQILKYQFPSAFSLKKGVNVNSRFKIHPFLFLLKLLMDPRIVFLTEEEIAKIIVTEAENETDKCYEYIVKRISDFRNVGDVCLSSSFLHDYASSRGKVNSGQPFSHLIDLANTIANWLEYTQLVGREKRTIKVLAERRQDVESILQNWAPFIDKPQDQEYFQRKYGLDPNHCKDTRNFNNAKTVTETMLAEHLVSKAFVSLALVQPIGGITTKVIEQIAESTGLKESLVQETLQKKYPHGAIGSFLSNYFEMAFKGTEECRNFEIATAEIFKNVFHFDSYHIAGGAKEVPDVFLVSKEDGYKAIIDTKAYSCYDLGAMQRDRMIHHYLPEIESYGSAYAPPGFPVRFFSYIAGGFSRNIASPLNKIVDATHTNGSAMPVSTFIKLAETHNQTPFTHEEICRIFSVNRQVELRDIESRL